MSDLYDYEEPVKKLGIDVPDWIDPDITGWNVAAIIEGGCASGAYMPAVTYYDADQTMSAHGDDVLQYIQDSLGEMPKHDDDISWSGLAVFYLSYAVELWASSVEGEIAEALEESED